MHKASNLWKKMSAHFCCTDMVFKKTLEKKTKNQFSVNITYSVTGEKQAC